LPNASVALQAIVLPTGAIDPTGTVQFFSGKTTLGIPVQVKNLIATLTTQLTSGSHSITAVYSGDPNFIGSTSGAATIVVGNPDFLISVNPGNVTISGTGPGTTSVLLTPAAGLGFSGPISLSCSGLPMSSSCTFLPAQPALDGFTPLTVALSITRPPQLSSAMRMAFYGEAPRLGRSFVGAALAGAFLLAWPKKKRAWRFCTILVLAAFLSAMSGCSGNPSASNTPSGPSTGSFVVTVTASGGVGAQAVSHSVTLQFTVQ
jgi:large repetitive protein